MSDRNESRAGYKETKAGWIPLEWEVRAYSEIFNRSGSPVEVEEEGEYREIGVRSHGKGIFHKSPVTGKVIGDKRVYWVEPNRLMFNIVFAWEQAIAVSSDSENGFIASHRFPMYEAANGYNAHFVAWYLKTPRGKYALGIASPGGAGRNRTLGQAELDYLFLPLPPLPEQEKISDILSTCDEAIEKTGALIDSKKEQKKALMQQLLTGKKRLPGFEGEWAEVRLREICTRLTGVAENPNEYPVLSITAGTGFVSQADKFSRVIAGKQVEKYVVLERGDFSYNKGNSNRYPQGCVYKLSEYDAGLVPNVFFSFRLDEKGADNEFIKQHFLAGLHNEDLYRWINSGVRNNGLLNLSAADFFKLPIDLPPIEEQQAIGSVLLSADVELGGLNQKLKTLQQQKKALMQKLLTGQVRVNV